MVDMSSGKYFHLNPTGSWIWEQFKQPNETGKVTSAFAKHFQVPEQIASKDVGALVQDLLERGLLQHASPPSN